MWWQQKVCAAFVKKRNTEHIRFPRFHLFPQWATIWVWLHHQTQVLEDIRYQINMKTIQIMRNEGSWMQGHTAIILNSCQINTCIVICVQICIHLQINIILVSSWMFLQMFLGFSGFFLTTQCIVRSCQCCPAICLLWWKNYNDDVYTERENVWCYTITNSDDLAGLFYSIIKL